MDRGLRALASLAEDSGLSLNNYMVTHNVSKSSSKESEALLWSQFGLKAQSAQAHVLHRTHSYTEKYLNKYFIDEKNRHIVLEVIG